MMEIKQVTDTLSKQNHVHQTQIIFSVTLTFHFTDQQECDLASIHYLQVWAPIIIQPDMGHVDGWFCLAFKRDHITSSYHNLPPAMFLPASLLPSMPQPPTNQAAPLETTELLGPLPSIAQAISWADKTSSESLAEQQLPLPPHSLPPKRSCPHEESSLDKAYPNVVMDTTGPALTDMTEPELADMTGPKLADTMMLAQGDDDSHTTLGDNVDNVMDAAEDPPFYIDLQEMAETSPGPVDKVMASFQDNITETILENILVNTPTSLVNAPSTTAVCSS